MIVSLVLNIKTKTWFDSRPIRVHYDPVKKRALSKMGAFVRRRMKSSIRKRKKSSKRGSPPSSHSTEFPNMKTIFFDVDVVRESVMVGPLVSNRRSTDHPAPEILEHGGTTTIKSLTAPPRRITIAPRPFAAPALEAEIDKFPELLRG